MKTSSDLSKPAQNQAGGWVEQAEVQAVTGTGKKYSPPLLTCYGEVRSLTLGPSPGIGESSNPMTLKA